MRQITRDAVAAFMTGRDFTRDNTTVMVNGTTSRMFLHGNEIAVMHDGDSPHRRVKITLAGWPTPTTRERVNGVLDALGVTARVSQRDFAQFLGGREITAFEWVDIT